MIDFFCSYASEIASFVVIIASIGAMIFWSHRRLHADIMGVRDDCKRAHDRIDQLITSGNQRFDQLSQRIDESYKIIIRMLEERK